MAVGTNFRELITKVQKALRLVDGPSVQIYSDDNIAQALQFAFNAVLEEAWWPEYMSWFSRTIDGTDGVTTQILDTIKQFEDIRAVFISGPAAPAGGNQQIPYLSPSVNPLSLTGTTPAAISPYDATGGGTDKIIQFWPKSATGDVAIHARVRPDEFTVNSTVRLDADLLVYHAVHEMLESDGTNPGATQSYEDKANNRLRQMKARIHHGGPLQLDPHQPLYPTNWWARP